MPMHEGTKATPESLQAFMWEEAAKVLSFHTDRAIKADPIGHCKQGSKLALLMDRFIAGERSQDFWREIMVLEL